MKKEYPVTLADEICFFMVEGMGLIVGKLNFNGNIIKKPRAVEVRQDAKDQPPQLRFSELLGSPEEMFLERRPIMCYQVRDKAMLDLYVTTTTGLIMPGPGNLPPASAGGLVS
jgi:hypothetical protein